MENLLSDGMTDCLGTECDECVVGDSAKLVTLHVLMHVRNLLIFL